MLYKRNDYLPLGNTEERDFMYTRNDDFFTICDYDEREIVPLVDGAINLLYSQKALKNTIALLLR